MGLTTSEAGFISGISYISYAISAPIWGTFADQSGHRKIILILICIGYSASVFSLPWIAGVVRTSIHEEQFGNRTYTNLYNRTLAATNETDSCGNTLGNNSLNSDAAISPCETITLTPFSNNLFYSMFILLFIAKSFLSPLLDFTDAMVINVIKNMETKASYGTQRMFGSLGYAVATLISGITANYYTAPNYATVTSSKYFGLFYVFLVFSLLTLPSFLVLFRQTSWQEPEAETERATEPVFVYDIPIRPKRPQKRFKSFIDLLKSRRHIFLMTSFLIIGLLKSIGSSFLYNLIEDEMQGSQVVMGIISSIGHVCKMIMFPFTDKIINMVGPVVCIEVSMLSCIFRLLVTSYIKNALLVIPAQVIASSTMALYWASLMEYTERISNKNNHITMVTLVSSLNSGAAGLIGNMVGGLCYGYYGGPVLYRGMAVFGSVWFIIMAFYFHSHQFKLICAEKTSRVITYIQESFELSMVVVISHDFDEQCNQR